MSSENLDHFGVANRDVPAFQKDWKERPLAINTTEGGIICVASIPSGKGTDLIYGTRCCIYLYPDGTYSAALLKSWHSRRGQDAADMTSRQTLNMAPQHAKLPWEE